MTAIPEFVLKKLIVQNSFKKFQTGFSFVIRNSFAPGNLTAFTLFSDGNTITNEMVTLQGEGQETRKSSEISKEHPFPLSMGLSVTVTIQGMIPGKRIAIKANTQEIGDLEFSFSPIRLKSARHKTKSYPLLKRWTAGSLHSTCKIDRSNVIGKINPYVYGHFIEHLENCIYGGIWTEDGKELRKDTFELIKALKPSIIRYPGGNFTSGYHWQDGIGPKEKRPQRFDAAWQAPESNQVGTDEYMDFIRKVECDPLLVVNDGSGTAEEAANWVAYCNQPASGRWGKIRAANGHSVPHNVKIWGVGNEVWGAWQIGTTNAENYSKRLIEFTKLMHKEDPSIKIVAVGNNPLSNDPNDSAARWNEIVLREAADQFDYLSWHIYQPDQTAWQEEPDVEKLHHIICAAPLDVEEIIQRVDRQIGRFAKNKRILQALDEWNLWPTPPEDAKSMHGLVYTMRDALYGAGMLNVFHRQCNSLEMSNLAQLVNVLPLIVTTLEMAYPTAMYFPFLMYTKMKTIALRVQVESLIFNSLPMGMNVKAHKDVPYLDITATSDGTTKLVLGLINRHPYSKMNVKIRTSGWENLKPVQSITLTSNPLDANTSKTPNKLHLTQTQEPNIKDGNLLGQLLPCSITVWEIDCQ